MNSGNSVELKTVLKSVDLSVTSNSAPKLSKPCRIGGSISDGVLNVPVAEIILNRPRICALVGQGKAASMPQHVRMSEKGQTGGGFRRFRG